MSGTLSSYFSSYIIIPVELCFKIVSFLVLGALVSKGKYAFPDKRIPYTPAKKFTDLSQSIPINKSSLVLTSETKAVKKLILPFHEEQVLLI